MRYVCIKNWGLKMKSFYNGKNILLAFIIGATTMSMTKENIFEKSEEKLQEPIKNPNDTASVFDDIDLIPYIENRADKIVRDFMDTIKNREYDLAAGRGKVNHTVALRNRFGSYAPTRPNGRYVYCLWALQKSLDASTSALGIKKPIPETYASSSLMTMMLQQNPENSFYGAIWEDKNAFSIARENFVNGKIDAWRKYLKQTPDSNVIIEKQKEFMAEFEKNNIAADDIKPGSIYSTRAHSEIFLGRGTIVDKRFVPNQNGKFYRIGFNIEMIRPLEFYNGKTAPVFIGNIYGMFVKQIQEQVDSIKKMSHENLVNRVLGEGLYTNANYLTSLSDDELKLLTLEKLFGIKLNSIKELITPSIISHKILADENTSKTKSQKADKDFVIPKTIQQIFYKDSTTLKRIQQKINNDFAIRKMIEPKIGGR